MAEKKKSPVKKKTTASRKGGAKRTASAKPSPKKKSAAKKTPLAKKKPTAKKSAATGKEAPRRAEGARSVLNVFKEKKRVKSLFALETRGDLKEKTVAELRAIAREAGIALKSRLKAEIARELADGLGLLSKVRKKPSATVKKPSPAGKKAAPAKKRVVSPARPILKEKPPVEGKQMEEALLPEASEVLAHYEEPEPLVEQALGDVLKEEAGEWEMEEIPFPKKERAPEKPTKERPAKGRREVDRVTAVAVDPRTVFVDWDMTEKTAKRGRPAIRIYDVTGVEFDGKNYLEYADMELSSRSGESFFEARPGREYIVDAGVVDFGGRFRPARRTSKVKMPPEKPPEGRSVLPEKYFRFRPGDYGHR